jgi:hypothetical protein
MHDPLRFHDGLGGPVFIIAMLTRSTLRATDFVDDGSGLEDQKNVKSANLNCESDESFERIPLRRCVPAMLDPAG